MVCEHITWRGRSAIRDAARVLGFSPEQAGALAAFSDRYSAKSTAAALRASDPDAAKPTAALADPFAIERADAAGPANYSKRALTEAIASDLVKGTHATTLIKEARAASRKIIPLHPAASKTAAKGESSTRSQSVGLRLEKNSASTAKQQERLVSEAPGVVAAKRPQDRAAVRELREDDTRDRAPLAQDRAAVRELREGDIRDRAQPSKNPDSLLRRANLDPSDPRVQKLAEIVEGLDAAPRHRGIHVGGFVLTEEPLRTVVPIEPASMEDRTVIQWEKDDLDPVGLIKIDLLGLGMLTVLQDCLAYLRTTRGINIDLGTLDCADQAVYDDLCRADTVGVFQVESRAQMNTLPRLKPRCFYDIVVQVALIRPGPIQGDMVHPYLRRRAGVEAVTYPHPSLEPILKRTLGVPLFQEQGMQVAIAAAGFTPGESDLLRKAMGHKRSRERMADICQKMLRGMEANGIPADVALRIFNQINAFADYGFPESHAASFALIVYASAYLRHYYAPEFLCAMLNAQPMGFYAPGTLIEDARRHGVKVMPVDVTRSRWDHTLERGIGQRKDAPPVVRLGIRSVVGLGSKAQERIETALEKPTTGSGATGEAAPFESISDFVHRTKLDRRSLRSLAESGAFDAFVMDEPAARRRRVALWRVLEAEREAPGPLALFPESRVPDALPGFTAPELTEADYRLTGLSLNGHPMRHLRALLGPNGVRTAREIHAMNDGDEVAHAGLVICRQRPGTAKGFVFLTLEDETGTINVVVTPQRFERQALLISRTPLLLVRGVLQVESGVYNIRAKSFVPLKAGAGEEAVKGRNYH
ncbi:MAG TPA: OB-fold nucleic acid binding domain-containing protein [Gemmatimonadaceae bacterium]|nr:OB-fold nucleic acid binding domain-containing protein [Gemmatimonadaceae bacterium]